MAVHGPGVEEAIARRRKSLHKHVRMTYRRCFDVARGSLAFVLTATLVASFFVASSFVTTTARAQTSAVSLRGAIDREHPGTEWIRTADLASQLTRPAAERPILLDVRSRAEFDQSHLHGAIRVEPGTTDLSQLRVRGRDLRGQDVVVYCSVGYRSAELVPAVRRAGARSVKNLLGGIFQWANEGRLLCDDRGRASQVHPYDAEWGRFLSDERRAPLNVQ